MTGRAAALHAHSGSQGVLPLVPDYQAGKACGEPSEFLMPESECRKKEPFPCLLYAIATGRPETGRLLGSGWPCGWLWPMVRVGRCGTSMGLKTPGAASLAALETRATTPRWASPGGPAGRRDTRSVAPWPCRQTQERGHWPAADGERTTKPGASSTRTAQLSQRRTPARTTASPRTAAASRHEGSGWLAAPQRVDGLFTHTRTVDPCHSER